MLMIEKENNSQKRVKHDCTEKEKEKIKVKYPAGYYWAFFLVVLGICTIDMWIT